MPKGGKKIDEVYVFLFETSGQEFYAKTFDYNKTGIAKIVSPGAAKLVKPGTDKNLVKGGAAKIADPRSKKVSTPDGLTNPVKKGDTIGPVGGKLSAVKLAAQATAGNRVAQMEPKDSAVKQYQVERKRAAAAFATVATVGAAKMDYEDGTVKPGVSYTYRIEAVPSAKGASVFSNEVTVKTPTSAIKGKR